MYVDLMCMSHVCPIFFLRKLNIRNAAIIFVSFGHKLPDKLKRVRTHTGGISAEKYRI